jgi:hypothetical protein
MVWWIAGGIAVLALIGLLAVLVAAFGSLRRFAAVALSLNRRLGAGAQKLQPRLAELQQTVEKLQEPLLVTQERAAILQARRGGSGNS